MKEVGGVNHSRRIGAPIYCGRACSGLARRVSRSVEELKRLKAEYDKQYRAARRDELKRKKREYFARTYNPEQARAKRAPHMQRHVEYCRRYYADPKKKREKYVYDVERRARMTVGEYADCMILLNELWKEIRTQQPSWYERKKSAGYFDKINERKRNERASRRTA